jgi:starvation-inducible DNA-binding protein
MEALACLDHVMRLARDAASGAYAVGEVLDYGLGERAKCWRRLALRCVSSNLRGRVMSKKIIPINIGIPEAQRAKIVEGLSRLLADSYTLYLMTHNFHWNVTGPMFNSLHVMFMGQYTEQWNALDLIAERIRSLGFPAPGTYKEFVTLASIDEVAGVPKALDMVRHLVNAQEATARTARDLFPLVDEANDQPTADLVTQRLDVHEKTAWMLRSLLEE